MSDRREVLLPLPVVAGWCEDFLAGTMARVSSTDEEERTVNACRCGLQTAVRNEVELAHTGGCGPPKDTCGKKTWAAPIEGSVHLDIRGFKMEKLVGTR